MTCTICREDVCYPHLVIINDKIHECCDACFEAICEGVATEPEYVEEFTN